MRSAGKCRNGLIDTNVNSLKNFTVVKYKLFNFFFLKWNYFEYLKIREFYRLAILKTFLYSRKRIETGYIIILYTQSRYAYITYVPIVIFLAINIGIPCETSQLGSEGYPTMAASQTSAVPCTIGSSEVPSFCNLSAAPTATKSNFRIVTIDVAYLTTPNRTIPRWGCTATTAYFLQHSVPLLLRRYHFHILQ